MIILAMWSEFRAFIARGPVMDLAVAVIIGAAFGRIVNTVVEGVLMPPLGMVLGRVDFASLFILLDSSQGMPASLADARARGIPVIAYGQLVNDVVAFVIVALVVFVLVRQVHRIRREAPPAAPNTRDCQYCSMSIPISATRCPYCTSTLGA